MTRTPTHRAAALAAVPAFACAVAAALPAPVRAAGIERVVPSARPLFRPGGYVEFNLAYVEPRLRGEDADLTAFGLGTVEGKTTNLFDSYAQFSLALKGMVTDRLSYMLVLDEPWGADTNYGQGSLPANPTPPPVLPYGGTTADLRSYQFTTALAYDVTPNVKVYGGLRAQRTDAEANIPFVGGYAITTDKDWGLGWMVGAGYQIPEIALAVSLTYYSGVDHGFDTTEFVGGTGPIPGTSSFETPQSVNLEFQSGVAADTLVFGSVRWVDWSSFRIAPENYPANPLVNYESDWWTYNLGVGRQIDENWAAALQITYEPAEGGSLTTLGPIDGRTILGGSLTYKTGPLELTGGASYGWLGDTANQLDTQFEDGYFTAFGIRVGYSF